MQKDLNASFLSEIYGKLLTERQREIISQYYDYDLSLQEISENLGISRQAVLDAIKKGCDQLRAYEQALGVMAMKMSLEDIVCDMEDGNYDVATGKLKSLLGG